MEQLLNYDHDLFLYLNGLGNESWDTLWLIITNKLYAAPLYALLIFFIYKKYGLRGTIISIVVVAAMITCTDQLANLFKHGFERPRPCKVELWKDTMRFVAARCGRYGFFSAHAASTMAAAVFAGLALKRHFRCLVFILLFWSSLVGYSRIYLGVHYPGDVIIGWIIGGIVGWIFYKLFISLNSKYGDRVSG
jgi:undecaprenyl-diphosphatase